MKYLNVLDLGDVTTNTVDPFQVTFSELPLSGTSIVSVKRFVLGAETVSVDIVANALISGQTVTVSNIWVTETKAANIYRVQIIAKATDGSVVKEANAITNVLY